MEMQIAWYYTLSTISQTLAGAFGFLVAMVLYRMQAIGGQLPDLAEMVINGTQQEAKSVSLRKMRARGQWADFFAMVHPDRRHDEVKQGPAWVAAADRAGQA